MIQKIIRILLAAAAVFLLSVSVAAAAPQELSPDRAAATQSGVTIGFDVTPDAQGKTARVGVVVTGGHSKVEAKTVQTGNWTDITRKMYVDLSKNGTVYVQVTDRDGNITAKSEYIDTAVRLRAADARQSSGSGAVSVAQQGAANTAQPADTTATPQSPATTDSTTVTPAPADGAAAPADNSGAVTPAPADSTVAASANGAAGQAQNTVNGVISVGNKQFITIETRDEKIFYLLIDGDKSTDNVYLVTEASTQDLISFTAGGASDGNNGQPAADADPASLIDGGTLPAPVQPEESVTVGDNGQSGAEETAEDTPIETEKSEDESKKSSPIPGWIVIAILVMMIAFAGYMFLVVLPRKKAKEAYADTDDDDEYEDGPEEAYDGGDAEAAQTAQEDAGEAEDENPLEIFDDDDYNGEE